MAPSLSLARECFSLALIFAKFRFCLPPSHRLLGRASPNRVAARFSPLYR